MSFCILFCLIINMPVCGMSEICIFWPEIYVLQSYVHIKARSTNALISTYKTIKEKNDGVLIFNKSLIIIQNQIIFLFVFAQGG